MTASQLLPYFSQRPEDAARRWRAYLEAIEPIRKQILRFYELTPRSFVILMHPDGTGENVSPSIEECMEPEIRATVELLRGQITAIAKQYGFEISLK